MNTARPSLETWLDEIKRGPGHRGIGIFFIHNGLVRDKRRDGTPVAGLDVTCDGRRLDELVAQTEAMPGVVAARAWVNEGTLAVGDDMIYVLVAGDVRRNALAAWQVLVRLIKSEVVTEREILAHEPGGRVKGRAPE
jgi:molybdopterin synthase catalytic subunit